MTTLDELERAVERLNRAVERLSGGMGKYGFANVYNDDVQLLLSERAELLDTVKIPREPTPEMVRAGCAVTCVECFADCKSSDVAAIYRAMLAASPQGEGSPIGQNDQPGLAFSDEGEP